MKFYEASAKDKININETFEYLVDYLIEHPLRLDKDNNVKLRSVSMKDEDKDKDRKDKENKKNCC